MVQQGSGKCSLCGSPGASKTTCPLNPKAKHPDPKKHYLAKKQKSMKQVVKPSQSKLLQLKGPGSMPAPKIKPSMNTKQIKPTNLKKKSAKTLKKSTPSKPSGFQRFEFNEGTSNKFWQIKVTQTTVEIHWGKIGSKGTHKVMSFDTPSQAKEYVDKQIKSKVKKGYVSTQSSAKSQNEIYYAKFHDIVEDVDPKYHDNGHLRHLADYKQLTNNVEKAIQKHPEIKPGDILFIGSTYETRQEYGFAMYLPGLTEYDGNKTTYYTGESGFDLPIEVSNNFKRNRERSIQKGIKPKKNLLENVKYSQLVTQFKETIDAFHKSNKMYTNWNEDLAEMFLGSDWRDDEDIEQVIQEYKKLDLWE